MRDGAGREIDAYSRYVKDREAGRALAGYANLAGLLIAYLVPEVEPGKRTDLTSPDSVRLSIPQQRLSQYRYLVDHDREYAREQFEAGKTLNAVLNAVALLRARNRCGVRQRWGRLMARRIRRIGRRLGSLTPPSTFLIFARAPAPPGASSAPSTTASSMIVK